MTRERCSEGWAVDKLRMVNQIKPKHRNWTPEVTGTIDRDKYDRTVINLYDHEPLKLIRSWDKLGLRLVIAFGCGRIGESAWDCWYGNSSEFNLYFQFFAFGLDYNTLNSATILVQTRLLSLRLYKCACLRSPIPSQRSSLSPNGPLLHQWHHTGTAHAQDQTWHGAEYTDIVSARPL